MPDIKALVAKLPPPGKLGRGGPPPMHDEPDADEAGGPSDYDEDDDKAAETSAAQRVADALGVKGVDTEELCEALKDFIATIKE